MQEMVSGPTQVQSACVINPLGFTRPIYVYFIGEASGDSNAEVSWKYYPTQVCLKYGLHLVRYPHEDICDPSNLAVNQIFALCESLQKGTCGFKILPDIDKNSLQLRVNEQRGGVRIPGGMKVLD